MPWVKVQALVTDLIGMLRGGISGKMRREQRRIPWYLAMKWTNALGHLTCNAMENESTATTTPASGAVLNSENIHNESIYSC